MTLHGTGHHTLSGATIGWPRIMLLLLLMLYVLLMLDMLDMLLR